MGLFDGIVSAGIDFLSQERTNRQQAQQAQIAQGFSAEQAQKQMDFQERMRASQYQTAVQDLTAAGLNPMLAYQQGGAGTPSGASAIGQQATFKSPTSNISNTLGTSLIAEDIELKRSQNEVNKENVKNISADTAIKLLQDPKIRQETKNLIQEEMRLREATTLLSAQRTYANAQEALTRSQERISRLGGEPEAKSKGLYFKDYPRGHEIKEVAQNAASAAQAGKKISEIVADVAGAARGVGQPQFQPNQGQKQPSPNKPYNPKRAKFGRR
jgi:hypothetical protein